MPETKQNTWFSWFVVMVAAMGGVLYGYDLGIISGALLFIKQDIPMSWRKVLFWWGQCLVVVRLRLFSLCPCRFCGAQVSYRYIVIIFLIGVFSLALPILSGIFVVLSRYWCRYYHIVSLYLEYWSYIRGRGIIHFSINSWYFAS